MPNPGEETDLLLAELARLPIGAAMRTDHLRRMARLGTIERFTAGACLFREGEPARSLRIILSGRVALTVDVPGQAPAIVAALSRGDLLGFSALSEWATPTNWSASATANQATSCLCFPGAELRELCENDHELGFHVMRHAFDVVSQRLRDCRVQLLDVFGT